MPLNAAVKAHVLMIARKFTILGGEKANQPAAAKKAATTLFQRTIPSVLMSFKDWLQGCWK